jgi:16S rRNA (cytosine1402-N4)-methyltransferase
MNPGDLFIGFDADDRNIVQAEERLERICPEVDKIFIRSNFVNIDQELSKRDVNSITAVYFDLGLSSLHLDEADRGFSFKHDGPLDMRFDVHSGVSAAFVLNNYRREQLIDILQNYGEEPMTKKIVAAICEQRKVQKFKATSELDELIRSVSNIPKSNTRVFQALRIEVNKELENLETALHDSIRLLESGGTIFVISFHSLEDRITKQIFKRESRDCICSDIICTC